MKKIFSHILFACLLFVFTFHANAVNTTDSLKQVLDGQTNDSIKIFLLNELSYEYVEKDGSLALYYAQKALEIANRTESRFGLMRSWGQMGSAFRKLHNYNRAIECYINGEKYADELNDFARKSAFSHNIGLLYHELKQYDKAEKFFTLAMKADEKTGDVLNIAITLNSLGALYIEADKLAEAKKTLLRSCTVFKESGYSNQAAAAYRNLGITERKLGNTAAAIKCFEKSFDLYVSLSQRSKAAECLRLLAGLYHDKKDMAKAIFYFEKSQDYANDLTGIELGSSNILYFVAEAYEKKGDHHKAYETLRKGFLSYQGYFTKLDSIKAFERDKAFAEMATKYDTEKTEKENQIQRLVIENEKASNSRKQVIIYSFVIGLVLLGGLLFMVIRSNNITKKASAEIKKQKEQIEIQRDEISYKNREITSSIEYAKSLQDAILPDESIIKKNLPQHFILWLPRDIVSGDFYWFYETPGKIFLAAADCTGHGVPGAFVSMTCHNILNQVVIDKKEEDPGQILSKVNVAVSGVFQREGTLSQANDGMDIALVAIDKNTKTVQYAGAMNPLVRIHNNEIIAYKADRYAIGGRTPYDYKFTTVEIPYHENDWLYMFSDGFKDQFGGKDGKKYMNARFTQLLLQKHTLTPRQQLIQLHDELMTWMGTYGRTDDVLVIGFKVN